jgi:hypothetical protein
MIAFLYCSLLRQVCSFGLKGACQNGRGVAAMLHFVSTSHIHHQILYLR